MSQFRAWAFFAILSLFICGICGCVPEGDEHADEQRDMHYQRGRSLVQNMDYEGAIDEYEKALEVNPRNSAAHFELGWLCEEKRKSYAEAIYHYQKHLQFQTNSPTRDQARDRIRVCLGELAKAEYSPPDVQFLRKEIERLNGENLSMRKQMDTMRTQMLASVEAKQAALADAKEARAAQAVAEASARAAADAAAKATAQLTAQASQPGNITSPSKTGSNSSSAPPPPYDTSRFSVRQPNDTPPVPAGGRPKTHVVRGGDTLASISQSYNIKLSALMAANPKVNPKRLKAGQVLNLP